jgi:predicted nucleotidyltransferase component of viral defense system
MNTRFAMADEFLKLSSAEQQEVINAAAPILGILPAVVEKDVWVCSTLDALFSIPDRRPMVFKGGTSLSKVFNLIERFSEDIDISINFLKSTASLSPKPKPADPERR